MVHCHHIQQSHVLQDLQILRLLEELQGLGVVKETKHRLGNGVIVGVHHGQGTAEFIADGVESWS